MTLFFITCAALLLLALGVVLKPVLTVPEWTYSRRRRVAASAGWLIIALCGGLYATLGAPRIITATEEREAAIAALKPRIVELSGIVQREPRNMQAWGELGELLLHAEQFQSAVSALRHAVVLSEGAPEMILAYAKAQILAAGGLVSAESKQSLDMVLLQRPNQPEALYFTARYLIQNSKKEDARIILVQLVKQENNSIKILAERELKRLSN